MGATGPGTLRSGDQFDFSIGADNASLITKGCLPSTIPIPGSMPPHCDGVK